MKKFLLFLLCVVLCLSMIACGKTNATKSFSVNVVVDEVPLSEDEQSLIELIGSDVIIVTDEDYISVVSELINHTAEYAGKVFQIEGILSYEGENVTISRTLVHGEETLVLGLPVRYLAKEFADDAWVRLTGIITDADGVTVIDAVAVEGLSEIGMAELEWDGNDTHQH